MTINTKDEDDTVHHERLVSWLTCCTLCRYTALWPPQKWSCADRSTSSWTYTQNLDIHSTVIHYSAQNTAKKQELCCCAAALVHCFCQLCPLRRLRSALALVRCMLIHAGPLTQLPTSTSGVLAISCDYSGSAKLHAAGTVPNPMHQQEIQPLTA